MTMRRSLLVSSCLLATACGGPVTPAPIPDPALPVLAPRPAAPPSASASAPPERAIPTLTEEELAPGGVHPSAVFAVEGATMVVDDQRIGRIVGGGIEWLPKTIPTPPLDGLGPIYVTGVYGRWPDSIGVAYMRVNGRMSAPSYFPLTGVGQRWSPGLTGVVYGAAQVGESTIVVGTTYYPDDAYPTVRGTAKRKPLTRQEVGCKESDKGLALDAHAVAATRAGTMVTVGQLCFERGAAAEVWDARGKSRIVPLRRLWKETWRATLLPGEGDELWAMSDPWRPVLRFHEGAFDPVPDLGRPIRSLFVSHRGVLHASDGRTVHRLDASGWTPVALLPPGRVFEQMVMDEQDTIWVSSASMFRDEHDAMQIVAQGVRRLRPGPAAPAPRGCATPFVHLYAASHQNGTTYTYPATRKALSSFPEAGALGLVEIRDAARDVTRQLGVKVTSEAQGEALIAHLHATMKDEDPRLFCFDVSTAKEVRNSPLQ
jgi:hypothetical protein